MIRPLLVLVLVLSAPVARAIEVQPVTSPGGIHAWLHEDHTLPIVSIEASFTGGSVLDPPGKEGAVALMTSLLEEGAGTRDAVEFAEERERLALRIEFYASRDTVSFSAKMLTDSLDGSVGLLRSALVEPRFAAEDVARVREQFLSVLAFRANDPGRVGTRAFYARTFPGHVYARPRIGTPETVAGLEIADLRAAHKAALSRDSLNVSVVGDITPDALGPLLDRLFADLPRGTPDLPPVMQAVPSGDPTVIDFDIPQSVVTFGHAGLPRDDPDFVPAFVMNHILGGGGFSSRLTSILREELGLTYVIYTSLNTDMFGQIHIGRFSSANGRVAEAIDLVRAEWRRMAEEGVTEAELADAKRYLTGAYPLRLTATAGSRTSCSTCSSPASGRSISTSGTTSSKRSPVRTSPGSPAGSCGPTA